MWGQAEFPSTCFKRCQVQDSNQWRTNGPGSQACRCNTTLPSVQEMVVESTVCTGPTLKAPWTKQGSPSSVTPLLLVPFAKTAALIPPMKRSICGQHDPVRRTTVKGQYCVFTVSETGALKGCGAASCPLSLPGAKGKVPASFGHINLSTPVLQGATSPAGGIWPQRRQFAHCVQMPPTMV